MVVFEPGKITASQVFSSSLVVIYLRLTVGSASSGSKSVKLEMRGNLTTPIVRSAFGFRDRRSNKSNESSDGNTWSNMGITPITGIPVRSSNQVIPDSRSDRCPRNLLIIKPLIKARSSGSNNSKVPTMCANTPPRSISATNTVFACK